MAPSTAACISSIGVLHLPSTKGATSKVSPGVVNVNQALNSGANASDLYLYTINTKNNVSKPMCENCIDTFGDRVADVFSH